MNTLFQKMRNNRVKLERTQDMAELRKHMLDRSWGRPMNIEPYEEQDKKNQAAMSMIDKIK